MSHTLPSTFTRYALSAEEQNQAQQFTTLNLQMMQNLMCDAAEEKLGIKFDPSNPLVFTQREAELMGQIGILKLLCELSQSVNPSHTI